MSRWLGYGAPAGVSVLLGAGAGLLGNAFSAGWKLPVGIGFVVSVIIYAFWEAWRATHREAEPSAAPPLARWKLTARNKSVAAGRDITAPVTTGDHSPITLVKAAPARPPEHVTPAPELHNLPKPTSGLFVGRDAELATLHERLAVGSGVVGQTLHGLGGVGKTEMVLRYAQAHLAAYSLTWWVSSETSEQVVAGIAALAGRLHHVSTLTDGYAWAVSWLQSHTGWLLVLDNVEDPATVTELLGAVQDRGRVVVTTRRDLGASVWAQFGLAPLRLDVLDRSASIDLLLRSIGRRGERRDADALAAEVGDLPLALAQAGAYIAQRSITIRQYLQRLAAQPAPTLAATAEGIDGHQTVARVWAVTMNVITDRAPLAGDLLAVLAWLAPEQLPIAILTLGMDEPVAVEDALALLSSYSMINRSDDAVSVHRLVQAVTRHQDNDPVGHRNTAVAWLKAATPSDPMTSVDGWTQWSLLLPHIDTLYGYIPSDEQNEDLLNLVQFAASYLQIQGQLRLAIDLFSRSAADYRRVLGADHPDTLNAYNNLAYAHTDAGHLSEAIRLHERNTAAFLRVLGADHRDTLNARNNLAYTYRTAGKLSKAIPLYEQTLADQLRVLGADDPDTLRSRNNLAAAYDVAGRFTDAIPLAEQNLSESLRVLGADHPETLVARNQLALAYRAAGRLTDAIPLFEQNAAERQRVLGPENPGTLTSRNNLAQAYQVAGRLSEAIPLFEQTFQDRLRVLGPDHPRTLGSRGNLAVPYRATGRRAEAIQLLEQNLSESLRALGSDHPDTLIHRNNLAEFYEEAGRLSEAIPLFEQNLRESFRVLGADHAISVIARKNLDRVLTKQQEKMASETTELGTNDVR